MKRFLDFVVKQEDHSFRLYRNGKLLSFWKDLPIDLKQLHVNVCVQIPRNRTAKIQLTKQQIGHPLRQCLQLNKHTKIYQPRYYAKSPPFNYGFIPQTWESPLQGGDDDPIDILELSPEPIETGSIFRARILGAFCLIDQGQIDWKIIVKKCQSKQFDLPVDKVQQIKDWFVKIKTYDGKKQNSIGEGGKTFGPLQSEAVIRKYAQQYKKLLQDSQCSKLREKYHI